MTRYIAVKFRTPEGEPLWRHFTRRVGPNREVVSQRQRDTIIKRIRRDHGENTTILEFQEATTSPVINYPGGRDVS